MFLCFLGVLDLTLAGVEFHYLLMFSMEDRSHLVLLEGKVEPSEVLVDM